MFDHKFLSPSTFIVADGHLVESLHILNDKKPEPYWFYMHDYKHFEAPTIVKHNEGHRPPRYLNIDQLKVITGFLGRQY